MKKTGFYIFPISFQLLSKFLLDPKIDLGTHFIFSPISLNNQIPINNIVSIPSPTSACAINLWGPQAERPSIPSTWPTVKQTRKGTGGKDTMVIIGQTGAEQRPRLQNDKIQWSMTWPNLGRSTKQWKNNNIKKIIKRVAFLYVDINKRIRSISRETSKVPSPASALFLNWLCRASATIQRYIDPSTTRTQWHLIWWHNNHTMNNRRRPQMNDVFIVPIEKRQDIQSPPSDSHGRNPASNEVRLIGWNEVLRFGM